MEALAAYGLLGPFDTMEELSRSILCRDIKSSVAAADRDFVLPARQFVTLLLTRHRAGFDVHPVYALHQLVANLDLLTGNAYPLCGAR